jgi:hypothetical protein
MNAVPIPESQLLSAALRYIARISNNGKHSQDIESSLFQALRNGTLVASADRYDEDTDTYVQEVIPTTFWRSMQSNEFYHFINNDGNATAYARIDDETPRYRNAEINTSALDKWLQPQKTQAAVKASGYITVTAAISWIAFGDYNTINGTLTDAESKKHELAKSSFLKLAQAGSLNIYGVNPKHTGSPTASTIVPREQILILISLSNHLIYKGENWTNLEVEKAKILELWPASKKESSNSVDTNVPYTIPDAPVHERANTSIGEPSQKEAAFALYKAELKGKVSGRKEARDWFKNKQYPATWGDSFVASLPKCQKRKRQRPSKKPPAI